jgi:hypothetical protein
MILLSLLFISLQVDGVGPCKTQPCSWILHNLNNWQNLVGVVQKCVAIIGLQEMPIQVPQDMAFYNRRSFFLIYV